jgi:hypothetical protein
MPLSADNFRDLCKSRDDWIGRVESHLRQSLTAAGDRHKHFTAHGGYTSALDKQKIEQSIQTIVKTLAANKAPCSQFDSTTSHV